MSGLAEEEVDRSPAVLWAKRLGAALFVIAALAGMWFLVKDLIKPTTGPARQVAKITIVPDKPPPPPPPPKEEKRPEPPKQSPKEVKLEQPRQEQPQPQQAEQLKMEGQGSDSGLAGLAAGAVSQEYAGQKIGGDGTLGGGSNRMQFAFFTNALQRHLQDELAKNKRLRGEDYRMVVRVWLNRDGSIQRVEVATSTGDRGLDETVRVALSGISAMRDAPPDDMPQPVRIRIANRGA